MESPKISIAKGRKVNQELNQKVPFVCATIICICARWKHLKPRLNSVTNARIEKEMGIVPFQ